jgi:hypothetical protein
MPLTPSVTLSSTHIPSNIDTLHLFGICRPHDCKRRAPRSAVECGARFPAGSPTTLPSGGALSPSPCPCGAAPIVRRTVPNRLTHASLPDLAQVILFGLAVCGPRPPRPFPAKRNVEQGPSMQRRQCCSSKHCRRPLHGVARRGFPELALQHLLCLSPFLIQRNQYSQGDIMRGALLPADVRPFASVALRRRGRLHLLNILVD